MRLLFQDFSLPHLLADDEFPIGGFAVQLEQWLVALSENGVQAGVLTWKGANAHVGRSFPFDLVETIDPKRGIRILKYFYAYIPALTEAAHKFRPDAIIQSCASVYTGILAHVARRLDVPFVYRVASDIETDNRIHARLARYERIAFRHGLALADLATCQNSYQLAQMRRAWPAKPLLLLPNAIRLVGDAECVRQRNARGYIAWLGNFRAVKNMPRLLRIAQSLQNVEFRIAGMAHEGMGTATRTAVAELRKLPNVRFVGYLQRAAVSDFLGRALALLCTSDYEGFSNTFLEALATGTPIVTRREVDPDGLVQRNGLGRVAEDGDGLARAIADLAQLSALEYDKLAGACRMHVQAHHAPRAAMKCLVGALEPVMAGKRAKRRMRIGRARPGAVS